jgi:hypothetical protein
LLSGLLALAAAIRAAFLAAGLAACSLAAIVAIGALRRKRRGLGKSGNSQYNSKRNQCNHALHINLLNVNTDVNVAWNCRSLE